MVQGVKLRQNTRQDGAITGNKMWCTKYFSAKDEIFFLNRNNFFIRVPHSGRGAAAERAGGGDHGQPQPRAPEAVHRQHRPLLLRGRQQRGQGQVQLRQPRHQM